MKNRLNCDTTSQNIDLDCVENYVESQIGCKLPWNTGTKNLRLCSTSQDFRLMKDYLNDTDDLSPNQMKSYFKEIGCKIPCDYEEFIPR